MKEPKLKQALADRKLSVYQVIRKLKLKTGAHIYDFTNGKRDIKVQTMIRIVKAMNQLAPDQPTTINDVI